MVGGGRRVRDPAIPVRPRHECGVVSGTVEPYGVGVTVLGDDALDFWLGDWSVSWPNGTGTNSIRRILNGRVIEEVFESHDADGSVLLGRSLSVRDSVDGSPTAAGNDQSSIGAAGCRRSEQLA